MSGVNGHLSSYMAYKESDISYDIICYILNCLPFALDALGSKLNNSIMGCGRIMPLGSSSGRTLKSLYNHQG